MVQKADFGRALMTMEIEYARFNRYDGFRALIEDKLAKGKFAINGKFAGGSSSEGRMLSDDDKEASTSDGSSDGNSDGEEEDDSAKENPWAP